jgi:hypothetical protein
MLAMSMNFGYITKFFERNFKFILAVIKLEWKKCKKANAQRKKRRKRKSW